MKTTKIQKRINHKAHVTTVSNGTMLASRQALYNNLFKAIKQYPQPVITGNESKLDLLALYNVHKAICASCLKALESKGNMSASELLRNVEHTVSMEDLQQQVFISFCECSDDWTISNDGKVEFLTDESIKTIFGTVSKYLYQFQVKHYKHLYIELDNEIVDANKSTELAKHINFDGFKNSNLLFIMFSNRLTDNDKQWLDLRIDGLSNLAISKAMNVSYEKIRATEKRVRRIWNDWNTEK